MRGTAFPRKTPLQSQADDDRRSGLRNIAGDASVAAQRRERATHRLAALGEMTGGIAHDFRNLLTVIESGLRLAEKKASEPERVRAYIAATREGIDRGLQLTSQLLAFAKHQELDAHAGNVNEFLGTFEPFLRYGAGPGIRVRLELGADIPNCLIDPALFDAAVLNLVVNGRDAMLNGGEIRVVTERFVPTASDEMDTYVRVRVEDNGCGMPAEVLQKVFDPFFTTKGDRGTGIGLAQVRTFVQMVGGQVHIASREGFGTTVELLFPAIHPDA